MPGRAEPTLVLFCGGMGGTPVEEMLGAALRECALDLLDEALGSGAYGGAVLVADRRSADALGARVPRGVEVDLDGPDAFHLGRRLTGVIERYGLERPVYSGCGLPFLKSDELAAVAHALTLAEGIVVSNNYFSADLVAFTPGSVASKVTLPDNDRILPMTLVQEAGFT